MNDEQQPYDEGTNNLLMKKNADDNATTQTTGQFIHGEVSASPARAESVVEKIIQEQEKEINQKPSIDVQVINKDRLVEPQRR